jgi:hypothetical protein
LHCIFRKAGAPLELAPQTARQLARRGATLRAPRCHSAAADPSKSLISPARRNPEQGRNPDRSIAEDFDECAKIPFAKN